MLSYLHKALKFSFVSILNKNNYIFYFIFKSQHVKMNHVEEQRLISSCLTVITNLVSFPFVHTLCETERQITAALYSTMANFLFYLSDALNRAPELQKSIYTTVLVSSWVEALGPNFGHPPHVQLSYKLMQALIREMR